VPDGFGGVYVFASPADFFNGNADQYRQAFGNPHVDFPATTYGAFVQDHWTATRQLTVDLGARYDFEHLPAGFNENTTNVSPRFGLAQPRKRCTNESCFRTELESYRRI
jgi:outer membrane receptor protein involved in Fe transport